MKKFEYFDHTADTLFRAYGKTFEEATSNLVLAVYNVIVETQRVEAIEEKTIKIKSNNRRSLIYDIMDEIVFLLDTESFLANKVESIELKENTDKEEYDVSIKLLVDTNAKKYDDFSQIKSATYSEMEIGTDKNGNVFIQAVLDL